MKIVFNNNRSMDIGSTRIHSYNIFHWFSELGYNVALNDWSNYLKYDVVIFGKNVGLERIREAKAQNPKLLCGSTNPSDYSSEKRKILVEANFFIVGSLLERDYYLEYNNNLFVFPLIERIFNKIKKHEDHKPIIIGYHGNLVHLNNFSTSLKSALENLYSEMPIKLIAIYNKKKLGSWNKSRPNIEIGEVQWELETIQEKLLQCDIGVVPGLVPIDKYSKKFIFNILKLTQRGISSYGKDYLIRFKNTTNAGRAFVFHQLGIPVVSDFLPTSFHILADPKCGYLAHSTEGWLFALRNLCKSVDHRQKIAQNALEEFNRLYDPLEWSKRLYRDIENLWHRFQV